MALTCRRGSHGSTYLSKSPIRSLEERKDIEGGTKLPSDSDDVLSFVESCAECRRKWLNGVSPDSARCGSVHHTGDNRPAELEVCRKKVVEIGGRLPTATQLHQAFIKILSKHLAANKKVNFVFQQQSSTIPMMNPSPTEIVELFSFVEATLIQYATIAGHFPSANASSVKARPKRSTKVDSQAEESRGEPQANATVPTTPRPKPKAQPKSNAQPVPMISPPKADAKPPEQKKGGKGIGKGKRGRSESRPERLTLFGLTRTLGFRV